MPALCTFVCTPLSPDGSRWMIHVGVLRERKPLLLPKNLQWFSIVYQIQTLHFSSQLLGFFLYRSFQISSGPLSDYLHLRAVGCPLCLSTQGSLSPKAAASSLISSLHSCHSLMERDSSAPLNLGWPVTNLTNSLWQKWHCANSGPTLGKRRQFPIP